MAGTTTYLQLVNKAIQEAGVDLASVVSGDFPAGTNTNAMLNRFIIWTSRAWKSIQQECYDWEFMQETAVINVDPGIMFYSRSTDVSTLALLGNSTVNVYDQDGSVAIPNLSLGNFTDLTGKYTGVTQSSGNAFGYVDIAGTSSSNPIQFALKPGAEYVVATGLVTKANTYAYNLTGGSHYTNFVNNIPVGDFAVCRTSAGKLVVLDSGDIDTQVIVYADASGDVPDMTVPQTFVDPTTGEVLISFGAPTGAVTPSTIAGPITLSCYNAAGGIVHSWKSFNFDEETGYGDFQENIQEINNQSFKIIDYYAGAPSQELPLPFMAWEAFRNAYSQPAAYPGTPRLISEDNTGRWQLYPQPQQKYTLKFDYIRRPQILSAYGDIPKGIEDDFMDIIMWQTLIYYGEYDSQPGVVVRATKHYRDLLSRLEQKNREKFHLKPKRLW